jgi:hypothetical protein
MNNDRFKNKMKKLEQEREEFVRKLTPEDQLQYQQIKESYNRQRDFNQDSSSNSNPQEKNMPKR